MHRDLSVPFDLYLDRHPHQMLPIYQSMAHGVRTAMEQSGASTVEHALMLPRQRWNRRAAAVEVLVLGTFRKQVPVILELAEVLAELYLELSVLPLLHPLTYRMWANLSDGDPRMYRRITRNAVRVYSRNLDENSSF